MPFAIGLDLGSTSITAIALRLDAAHGGASLAAVESQFNDAETTSATDKPKGRSEWDLERTVALAIEAVRRLVQRIDADGIVSVGVTGQQQGCQLLDDSGDTIGPFIAWQDQRGKDRHPRSDGTFIDVMGERGGAVRRGNGLPAFANTGCPIVTGYTVPSLFWLAETGELPSEAVRAITGPEFLVHRLVGSRRPVTDPTDAASWGVLNVPRRDWNFDLIDRLGIDRGIIPDIRESCTLAGGLDADMASAIGLTPGIPISVASGDHQSAFVGAIADSSNSVAINIGTGGQASVYLADLAGMRLHVDDGSIDHGWLELRPHVERGYLLAGVGVVGGRTFRTLKDFIKRVGKDVFGVEVNDDAVYDRLVPLAGENLSTSVNEGMTASALFTGSRENPGSRGAFGGITPGNFTVGSMALALFQSMARELAKSYRSAVELGAGKRDKIVGSGNGLRKNETLVRCLEAEFGDEVLVGSVTEEAAVGAALVGCVAAGVYADIGEASKALVR